MAMTRVGGRQLAVLFFWLLGCAWPQAGRAVIGTHDNVPAATLLLPYFEVDLANVNAATTVLNLSNASATSILTNVTLWSTEGVSLLNFNVFLVGYDQQALDLRAILAGTLPQTASAGQDPSDTISPKGSVLSQDINFASCNGILPPAALPAADSADLRAGLTGVAMPSQGGLCASANQGDNIARGYLTIDAVNACSALDPDEAGYTTFMTQQNVLFGDFQLVHPGQNFAAGESLVAIEASGLAPLNVPGNYTFYGKYNNATAADRREPLGERWAQSRLTESPTPDARVAVWRDNKRSVAPFNCAGGAAALRIQAGTVTDRDALGNQQAATNGSFVAPQVSQQLSVTLGAGTSSPIQVGSRSGWLEFDLGHTLSSGNFYGNHAQSYPIGLMGSYNGGQGRFRVSTPPVQLQAMPQPPTGIAP